MGATKIFFDPGGADALAMPLVVGVSPGKKVAFGAPSPVQEVWSQPRNYLHKVGAEGCDAEEAEAPE